MRKDIYLAIVDRLSTLKDEDGTPTIKHFDLWNQNVESIDMEQPSLFPLCFIEFLPIKWSGLGGGAQEATVSIRLHIVSQWLYPTEEGSEFQSQGLKYLELLDEIGDLLQGFRGEKFGSFTRTTSDTCHDHAGIIENIEEFCVTFKSKQAQKLQPARPRPIVSNYFLE